jgi:hypothetical protein
MSEKGSQAFLQRIHKFIGICSVAGHIGMAWSALFSCPFTRLSEHMVFFFFFSSSMPRHSLLVN